MVDLWPGSSGWVVFSAGCGTDSGSADIRLSRLVETLGCQLSAGGELKPLFRCLIFERKPSVDTFLGGSVALLGTSSPSSNLSAISLSTATAFRDSEVCLAPENGTE
jgi:hypothetical protein